MKAALALAIASIAGCTTENITNVYVVDSDLPADTTPPTDSGATRDTFVPPPDSGSLEDAADGSVDAVADAPHVRCQVESGVVYEGCNGKYAAQGARIQWSAGTAGMGLCPSEAEDAGSPPGNCPPEPPCTMIDGGVMCGGGGVCTVSGGFVPVPMFGSCI